MSSNVVVINRKIINDESSTQMSNPQINIRVPSYNSLKNIPNIDELSIEDDTDCYRDGIVDKNADFDEKDEYLSHLEDVSVTKSANFEIPKLDYEVINKADLDIIPEDLGDFNRPIHHEEYNLSGKSKFYFPDDASDTMSNHKSEFNQFYTNDNLIYELNNVICLYSSSILRSKLVKNTSTDTIKVKGKLILTNYQLIFLPNKHRSINFCELDEDCLSLFNNDILGSFVIPLSFIYELKTSNSSHKYRPVSNVIENTSTGVLRDILIKCKNFMTKLFFFSNPDKEYNDIINFITKLIKHSNYQRVIQERFKNLVQSVNAKLSRNRNLHQRLGQTISQELEESEDARKEGNYVQVRKSYLLPSDLQQDLIDNECDGFMQVKSGFAMVTPDKFKINTNMPFCAIPKNVAEIILEKRVVANEQNVLEFANDLMANPRNSTVSLSPSTAGANRFSKRASTIMGVSPRAIKSNYEKASVLNQLPFLAHASSFNPFADSQFPVWSFTNSLTGCSLIVVPDAAPNRKDECDNIIKNYNVLLCDKNTKLKNLPGTNRISVGGSTYNEYEFFKFQVPMDYTDITKTYLKLMEMCSFKTKADYIKVNESISFYSRLQNSKWLKKVSTIIGIVSKIVNCLHFEQRNVFLEELKSNRDCSCIITSLVKICMHQRNRTMIGFENLIQKEWFLMGHLFNKRLQAPSQEDLEEPSDNSHHSSNQIAPTFLLFLDCVFQLIQQYSDEFEFNEVYLIHMWDYACSGMSYTFSFDGIMSFLNYLNTQTFLASNIDTSVLGSQFIGQHQQVPKFEGTFLNEIFEMNSQYWVSHLNRVSKLVKNQNFVLKKEASILSPNDRIYMLKFWSRCYLRWHENHHAYRTTELDQYTSNNRSSSFSEKESQVQRIPTAAVLYSRPAPAPPLFQQYKSIETVGENFIQNVAISESNTCEFTSGSIKVKTRTTTDGNIESSF